MTYLPRVPFQVHALYHAFSIRMLPRTVQSNMPVCGLVSIQRVCPALTPRYRRDEPVSPNQTTLLKLLDSFLHAVPTPFRDRGDYWDDLAGFLASAFHVQAEYTRRAIRQVTGDPLSDQNAATDVHGVSTVRPHPADCPLDGRLPGVWVALVLLSTSLSSILLCEQEDIDNGGADPGPEGVVTSSHGTISASRSRAGTGFVEELVGMMVPWVFASCRSHTGNRFCFFRNSSIA